jgi:hypothetical protein
LVSEKPPVLASSTYIKSNTRVMVPTEHIDKYKTNNWINLKLVGGGEYYAYD